MRMIEWTDGRGLRAGRVYAPIFRAPKPGGLEGHCEYVAVWDDLMGEIILLYRITGSWHRA